MNYQIVSTQSESAVHASESLSKKVNALCLEGWVPTGGVAICELQNGFCSVSQALYKATVTAADRPRFVYGYWNHTFAPAERESTVRFVFDQWRRQVLLMDVRDNKEWRGATPSETREVQESLLDSHSDALETPISWGLTESDSLPSW